VYDKLWGFILFNVEEWYLVGDALLGLTLLVGDGRYTLWFHPFQCSIYMVFTTISHQCKMSTIVNLQQIPHRYLTIELMKPENLPLIHVMSWAKFTLWFHPFQHTIYVCVCVCVCARACCLLQFDISVRYQLMSNYNRH
jgi:hypothetical protein